MGPSLTEIKQAFKNLAKIASNTERIAKALETKNSGNVKEDPKSNASCTHSYRVTWRNMDILPDHNGDCYVTVRTRKGDGYSEYSVEERTWNNGWCVYCPEDNDYDYDIQSEVDDFVAWAYKPVIMPFPIFDPEVPYNAV